MAEASHSNETKQTDELISLSSKTNAELEIFCKSDDEDEIQRDQNIPTASVYPVRRMQLEGQGQSAMPQIPSSPITSPRPEPGPSPIISPRPGPGPALSSARNPTISYREAEEAEYLRCVSSTYWNWNRLSTSEARSIVAAMRLEDRVTRYVPGRTHMRLNAEEMANLTLARNLADFASAAAAPAAAAAASTSTGSTQQGNSTIEFPALVVTRKSKKRLLQFLNSQPSLLASNYRDTFPVPPVTIKSDRGEALLKIGVGQNSVPARAWPDSPAFAPPEPNPCPTCLQIRALATASRAGRRSPSPELVESLPYVHDNLEISSSDVETSDREN